MSYYVVYLETSGNQEFVFSTNRLREMIGASEQTYRAGTEWVLDAVAQETKRKTLWDPLSSTRRKNLCDKKKNPPIEDGGMVEVIEAMSGKALLLTADDQIARVIIRTATGKALKEAPGLDLCGTYTGFDWSKDVLHKKIAEVKRLFEHTRSQISAARSRFLRLPVVAECSSSGWPAMRMDMAANEAISAICTRKRIYGYYGYKRLKQMGSAAGVEMQSTITDIESALTGKDAPWLGIVHADGNGFGDIITHFDKSIGERERIDNRDYINRLREFSAAIESCVEDAFFKAVDDVCFKDKRTNARVAPFIFGGDDLTFACTGTEAIPLAAKFLSHFESLTKGSKEINMLTEKYLTHGSALTACAGVAIVKPHFPFFSAYELAEQLCQNAKKVKTRIAVDGRMIPCSALDFHVLFDSSFVKLDNIHAQLTNSSRLNSKEEKTLLYGGPYIVSALTAQQKNSLNEENKLWAEHHRYDVLVKQAVLLNKRNSQVDDRSIPSSQLHELRTYLHHGRAESDGYLRMIEQRYPDLRELCGENGDDDGMSLWLRETDSENEISYSTLLLDTMLLHELSCGHLVGEDNKNGHE